MLNALTIDVEDYYHVAAFESVIRHEEWDRFESRVERNTYRLVELLEERNSRATFFFLGWVAERLRNTAPNYRAVHCHLGWRKPEHHKCPGFQK